MPSKITSKLLYEVQNEITHTRPQRPTSIRIGLGCWQLGDDFGPISQDTANEILAAAQQQQVNFLDTADVYGAGLSESRIGQWLANNKHNSAQTIVATKVGRDAKLFPNQYTKQAMQKNIEGSLQRLGVDAIDLIQLHCIPREVLFAGEVFNWLEDFQQQGLIRFYGASVEMLDEAEFCLNYSKVTSLQMLLNIFRQDALDTVLPLATSKNVGIIARLPLVSGLLSGKMSADRQFSAQDHRNYNKDGAHFHVGETFNGIAFEQGLTLVEQLQQLLIEHSELDFPTQLNLQQIAIRWLLDLPAVSSVIAGVSKSQQLINNAAVSQLDKLPAEVTQLLADFFQQKVRQHIRGGI